MKNNKRLIFGGLSAIWSLTILSFSTQTAEKSSALSRGTLFNMLALLYKYTNILIDTDTVHTLFRKIAHFSEYFLLGILVSLFIYTFSEKIKLKGAWVILYGFIWAFIDEFSQFLYGHGRSMQFSDMLIDTVGVIVAVLIVMLFKIKRCKV